MKVFCLDTNAVLDFCYRFYPQDIFIDLWELINASIIARQIKFVITKDIHAEIFAQIQKAGYNPSVFNDFMMRFCVQIIDDYDVEMAQLKAKLMGITKSIQPSKFDLLNNDLSNICIHSQQQSTVITSEQGFNKPISEATNTRELKIPDICRHLNIDCGNWLLVFHDIGFKA